MQSALHTVAVVAGIAVDIAVVVAADIVVGERIAGEPALRILTVQAALGTAVSAASAVAQPGQPGTVAEVVLHIVAAVVLRTVAVAGTAASVAENRKKCIKVRRLLVPVRNYCIF